LEAAETEEKATPVNAVENKTVTERLEQDVKRNSSPSKDISAKYMNGAWPGESVGTASNNDNLKSSMIENKSSPVDPAEDQNLQSLHSSLKNDLDQMQQSVKKRNHEHA
jgi:hypothetical protein